MLICQTKWTKLPTSKTHMSHLEENARKANETRWNKAASYSQEYVTQKREQTKQRARN